MDGMTRRNLWAKGVSGIGKVTKVDRSTDKKPCIVIADTDFAYTAVLHVFMVIQLKNSVDVIAITDKEYFKNFSSAKEHVDVLLVSEQLFCGELLSGDIKNIFILTEKNDWESLQKKESAHEYELIFRYSSPDIIFRKITGAKAADLQLAGKSQGKCPVTAFSSVLPDQRKTPIALATAECLFREGIKTLYINCAQLHTFQFFLKKEAYIRSEQAYKAMSHADEKIYEKLKGQLIQEHFIYLPAFRAPALSLGIDSRIYENLVEQAAVSQDFDHIIIDLEPVFNAENAVMMALADKVVLTADQSAESVFALKVFMENINDTEADKFLVVCSNFDSGKENAFTGSGSDHLPVLEYIEYPGETDMNDICALAGVKSICRVAHFDVAVPHSGFDLV